MHFQGVAAWDMKCSLCNFCSALLLTAYVNKRLEITYILPHHPEKLPRLSCASHLFSLTR